MGASYIIPEFEIERNEKRCTMCGSCVTQCSNGVHTLDKENKVMLADESKCVTIPKGLITCMRTINEQCVRQLNGELDESFIQDIMRFGRCEIDRKYYDIAKAEIEVFCEKVYNSIREYGYNLSTTPIVFVGGGASVMKLFGGLSQSNITYILDVKANAKGYEQLAMMALRKMKKLA